MAWPFERSRRVVGGLLYASPRAHVGEKKAGSALRGCDDVREAGLHNATTGDEVLGERFEGPQER